MTLAHRASRIVIVAAIVLAGLGIGGAHAIAASCTTCTYGAVPDTCGPDDICAADNCCQISGITVTGSKGGTTFASFVTGLIGAINTIVVPVIFALAFLVFVWGVVKYFFFNGSDETARTEGKQFMLWGILGLALLFSVWGLVNLLLSTLGIAPSA